MDNESSGSSKFRIGNLGDRLKDATADFFEWYGEFVGRHPGKIIIASLVFTLLCIPGICFIKINLDLYKLFVPLDAPVRHEFEGAQIFNHMALGNLDTEPPPPLVKDVKTDIIRVRTERASKDYGEPRKRKQKKGEFLNFFRTYMFQILMPRFTTTFFVSMLSTRITRTCWKATF